MNCYKLCNNLVISDSVTVVTVDGTDTLVIDVPATTFTDGCRYEIVVAQTIPATATINMPVAISIAGDTSTVYNLVRCDCAQITACAIRARTRYPVLVATNAIGGVFKVLRRLPCYPDNRLRTLPVVTATAGVAEASTPTPLVVRKTTTKKEVSNE
ncbi:MAG: hypothetical protein J6A98_00800 [Clostridia bacterium]|nr:hypothetical protein [Clostridia bacterium]